MNLFIFPVPKEKKNFIEKYSLKQPVDEIEKIVASSKLVSGKDEY